MDELFLLSDAQMRRIKPYFPLSHGVPRVDDRRVGAGGAAHDRRAEPAARESRGASANLTAWLIWLRCRNTAGSPHLLISR